MFKWLWNKFFTKFEDETIIFKLKIKSDKQNYDFICTNELYGYWKYSSDFFYTSLGLLHTFEGKRNNGKYYHGMENDFLHLVEEEFIRRMRTRRTALNGKLVVPIQQIIEKIDK